MGRKSAVGKMNQLVLGEEDPTPLQDKLKIVAENIGKYGSIAAGGIVFILFIKSIIGNLTNKTFDAGHFVSELLGHVLIGVTKAFYLEESLMYFLICYSYLLQWLVSQKDFL